MDGFPVEGFPVEGFPVEGFPWKASPSRARVPGRVLPLDGFSPQMGLAFTRV